MHTLSVVTLDEGLIYPIIAVMLSGFITFVAWLLQMIYKLSRIVALLEARVEDYERRLENLESYAVVYHKEIQ